MGEAGKLLNKRFEWAGENMLEVWTKWWKQYPEGNMRNLPLIIGWGYGLQETGVFSSTRKPR